MISVCMNLWNVESLACRLKTGFLRKQCVPIFAFFGERIMPRGLLEFSKMQFINIFDLEIKKSLSSELLLFRQGSYEVIW